MWWVAQAMWWEGCAGYVVDYTPIIEPLRGPTCMLKTSKISTQVEIASWARVWQLYIQGYCRKTISINLDMINSFLIYFFQLSIPFISFKKNWISVARETRLRSKVLSLRRLLTFKLNNFSHWLKFSVDILNLFESVVSVHYQETTKIQNTMSAWGIWMWDWLTF